MAEGSVVTRLPIIAGGVFLLLSALGSLALADAPRAPDKSLNASSVSNNYVKVRSTKNTNYCDPNDELVKKYRPNFLVFINEDENKVTGSGLLLAQCSVAVSAAHSFYSNAGEPYKNMSVELRSTSNKIVRKRLQITHYLEGKWREGLFKEDFAALRGVNNASCGAVRMIEGLSESDIRTFAAHGVEFYILKIQGASGVLCAQKCNILESDGDSDSPYRGAVGHDCSTGGGNSGSPIFVKAKNGQGDFFVGVHVGFHLDRDEYNLFAIVNPESIGSP